MSTENDNMIELQEWKPAEELRVSDSKVVNYSTGFLRSQPRQWFPGIRTQWFPLAHSLGIDVQLLEVTPVLSTPVDLDYSYSAKVGDEYLCIMADTGSANILINAFAPGGGEISNDIVAEYLTRRFFTSIATTWSGPEIPAIQFDSLAPKFIPQQEGAIKVIASVNSQQCTLWISLGNKLVQMLDGLWKRQVHSRVPSREQGSLIRFELAHLSVPPSMLTEYLKTGAAVDLEITVSDRVNLVIDGEPWLPGRLWQVDGKFAVETIAGSTPAIKVAEGTTKLVVELAAIPYTHDLYSVLSQPGSMINTGMELGNRVSLIIHGEKVGQAVLKSYQGRFVISVL